MYHDPNVKLSELYISSALAPSSPIAFLKRLSVTGCSATLIASASALAPTSLMRLYARLSVTGCLAFNASASSAPTSPMLLHPR